tara:strand:+ start:4404 stop:4580 length:177 start_codon:yes stop_codon:yes gene_type:complete
MLERQVDFTCHYIGWRLLYFRICETEWKSVHGVKWKIKNGNQLILPVEFTQSKPELAI